MFKRNSNPGEDEELDPSEFMRRADEVIFAAKKLRHPVLFRECFIHLVAILHDVSCPESLCQDKDLWQLLNAGKSDLRQMIIQAQHAMLLASIDGLLEPGLQSSMMDAFREDPESATGFYRGFLDHREQTTASIASYLDEVQNEFAPVAKLLRSNLTLDRTGFRAGEGPYHYTFLCAELEDEDMPWDASEFDW
jgi:hypothetical protein